MKNPHLTHAKPALSALPAELVPFSAGSAGFAGFACVRCKTEREVLDAVRLVFPNAKYVRREPPLDLVAKECLVCGKVYYGRSEDESQYCSNGCASVGHRQHKNPHKTRIRSLRDQCRASSRRASSRVEPESFEKWLYYFEEHLVRRLIQYMEPDLQPYFFKILQSCVTADDLQNFREWIHRLDKHLTNFTPWHEPGSLNQNE